MIELPSPSASTEVLLLHAPYPGVLKFQGQPSGLLAAIAPFAHRLNDRAELHRIAILDPDSPGAAYELELRAALASPSLRVLCVSSSTAAIEEAAWAVALARELCGPDLLVLVGGPHEDDCEEKCAHRISGVDVSIGGEAEFLLDSLLSAFLRSSVCPEEFLEDGPGASWCDTALPGGRITMATPWWGSEVYTLELERLRPEDISEPVWTKRRAVFSVFDAPETLPLLVSRGCSYGKCTFCAEPSRGHVTLHRGLSWVEEAASARPGAALYFQDSIFPAGQFAERELLPMLARLGRPWGCQAFLPTLSPAFVGKLADAGCSYVYTGLESASSDVLTGIGKTGLSEELALERLGWLRDAGISAGVSLMFGALSLSGELLETPDTVEATVLFAERLLGAGVLISGFYPNVTTVLPGTALARGLAHCGTNLDFFRVPRSVLFDGLEDGGVGYNFTTLPGGERASRDVGSLVVSAALRVQMLGERSW